MLKIIEYYQDYDSLFQLNNALLLVTIGIF